MRGDVKNNERVVLRNQVTLFIFTYPFISKLTSWPETLPMSVRYFVL